jgi:phosphoserine phosphatase
MSLLRTRVGAFFDLDGTLLPPPSLEWRFFRWLCARRAIGASEVSAWLLRFCARVLCDPLGALRNKAYLGGLPCSLAGEWLAGPHAEPLHFYPRGLARLEWHAQQGHSVFLVSGTLFPLAEQAARRLPVPAGVFARQLESADGRWTGRVARAHQAVSTVALKAGGVAELAEQPRISLRVSFAYGNTLADRVMLARVGNPVAVNPSPLLAWLAWRRRWPACSWTSNDDKRTSPIRRAHDEFLADEPG